MTYFGFDFYWNMFFILIIWHVIALFFLYSTVPDESAAVPPVYKYNKAQQIDLVESVHLQKLQKQKQEVGLSLWGAAWGGG